MSIVISHLQKQYDDNFILDIPSLIIEDGELVGLVGNNGAGKTTLLRLMLDLIETNHGQVVNNGSIVSVSEKWKWWTGSFLDRSFLIDFYTPEEYFGFIAEVYNIAQDELNNRLAHFMPLMNDEILDRGKIIHDFSMGNRQKIGIIGAMLVNPKILVLDEPFNFLDPSSQHIVAHLLQEIRREIGTTIILSSHNLSFVNDICTRIILLDKGHILMDHFHREGDKDVELERYFLES
ncbi:MAG: ABC transporter ATP-binding protein [Bacteroidales bacterium]|nr:ABC transporter ATP-binding protein [Bacteroidales bacterium]